MVANCLRKIHVRSFINRMTKLTPTSVNSLIFSHVTLRISLLFSTTLSQFFQIRKPAVIAAPIAMTPTAITPIERLRLINANRILKITGSSNRNAVVSPAVAVPAAINNGASWAAFSIWPPCANVKSSIVDLRSSIIVMVLAYIAAWSPITLPDSRSFTRYFSSWSSVKPKLSLTPSRPSSD